MKSLYNITAAQMRLNDAIEAAEGELSPELEEALRINASELEARAEDYAASILDAEELRPPRRRTAPPAGRGIRDAGCETSYRRQIRSFRACIHRGTHRRRGGTAGALRGDENHPHGRQKADSAGD